MMSMDAIALKLEAENLALKDQISELKYQLVSKGTIVEAELESQLTTEREARQKAEAERIELHQLLSAETASKFEYKKLAEAAEARIKASQEQEPCSFEVYNEDGVLYSASYAQACHEHINDAINEFEIEGAGKWRVRPVYAQPIIPPEVSELQRENTELTRKLAEQQSQNNFDATRLRRLCTFCGVAAPDSDEELLQVAGVVIGSCLRNLTKLLEEDKRQAVPQLEDNK